MSAATCEDIRPSAAGTATTLAAVGLLVAVTAWASIRAEPALTGLDLVTAVASVVTIAWVRRQPVTGGLAAGVLVALSPVATPVASFAALYAASTRPFRLAAAVAATGVAGQAGQGLWRPVSGLSYGWWLLLMAAAYAALLGWGTWLQARRNLLAALRDRARRAEREQRQRVVEARRAERNRIAREMHDLLAHRLSLLAAYAGAIEYRPDSSPERLVTAAAVVRDNAHRALDELREVITLLRSDDQDDADPDAPAAKTLADVTGLVEEARAAGQSVQVTGAVPGSDVPPLVGGTAYRVVREALTNARRHAPGQPVALTVEGAPGGRLSILVANPTVAEPPTTPGTGTGLVGLAERVELAGGGLSHETDDAGEFRLSAWIPWPA